MMTSSVESVIYRRGRVEADKLTSALIDLAARGVRPRCGDYETSHLWLSEDQQEREQAARLCRGCEVIIECGEVGKASKLRCVWRG